MRRPVQKKLFDDPDHLDIEIKADRTRVKDLFIFIFIMHRDQEDRLCGMITLERVYAVQLELALEKIDCSLNVRIKGSAISEGDLK